MKTTSSIRSLCSVIAVLLLVASGCGKAEKEITGSAAPPPPKEAASQIQRAFTAATPEVKKAADVAAESLRTANYEQAIQTLQTMKSAQNLTVEQGTAIYNSEQALEARLISAMAGGDQNAKRAYEMLKKSRRN